MTVLYVPDSLDIDLALFFDRWSTITNETVVDGDESAYMVYLVHKKTRLLRTLQQDDA